jgi:DegV family protein with EDD domain
VKRTDIAIVTDSVACVPEDLAQELDIRVVPYYIHREHETLRDTIDVRRSDFYAWLPNADSLPTTACPGPGDYAQAFEGIISQGRRQILSLHMTSKGSGAYQSASNGREIMLEKYPGARVEVVDTLSVSMCLGWMVIEAARAAQRGADLDAILVQIQEMIPITRMIQTADTLKYLHMGGRIGRAEHLVGSLLNIKPLISMRRGEIVALGSARSRARAYKRMVEIAAGDADPGGHLKVAYVHAAAEKEARKIQRLMEERLLPQETIFAELPPALGVHTGPGTAGICYFPPRVYAADP